MAADDQVFSSEQVLSEFDADCTFISIDAGAKNKRYNSEELALKRHWSRRHTYFSKYESGILVDRTGWFSVTPEAIAKQIASFVPQGSIVFDGFVGVGGNAIQFALNDCIVIGTDIDGIRLRMCQHNARVYEAACLELIQCDYFQACRFVRADVVFLSPPWGGPECNQVDVFRLDDMPFSGKAIIESARQVSNDIVFYLPRHTSAIDIANLGSPAHPFFRIVLHHGLNNTNVSALSAMFGKMFISKRQEKRALFNQLN